MAKTPEGRVKDAIRGVFDNFGADLYVYWPVPSGYGATTVDVIGWHRGRAFAIEAKRPGKKPTPLQAAVLDEMRDAGGETFVIDTEEMEGELLRLLNWLREG